MKIEFLNHASMLLDFGSTRLVSDPWYFGHCFEDGWGLKYENTNALERASQATHLWISHFHPDHFHSPTLARLAELSPEMVCLANESSNFKMGPALRRLGFRNIVPFPERTRFQLADGICLTRFPATGIDNMLLVEAPDLVLLNYNDCQLPLSVVKKLLAGKTIDILQLNFNIAEKLLDYPHRTPESVRQWLSERFEKVVRVLDPKFVIPFASHHYFRAPESLNQNEYLMESTDLTLSPKVVSMPVGSRVEWKQGEVRLDRGPSGGERPTARTILERESAPPLREVLNAADRFRRELRRHFLGVTFWIGSLSIHLPEHDGVLVLRAGRKPIWKANLEQADIQAHPAALVAWFSKRYGTDSLYVGGHFRVLRSRSSQIRRFLLACMLMENRLDPLSLFLQLVNGKGFSFLFNRREEVASVVLGRKFSPGIGARE